MKENLLTWVLLSIILSNLYIVSVSRLTYMIRGVTVQGVLLSMLPLLLLDGGNMIHMIILVAMGAVIKGIVIPKYLMKTIRNVKITRELNPVVGYSLSIIYGLVTTAISFYVVKKIGTLPNGFSSFHASAAIATALIGIFIIIARRKVVAQIIGYLVLENSGFILGLSVAVSQPFFVEMGVLLDMVVGVFIMTMAVNHIYLEYNSINVKSLERLTQ